MLYAIVAMLAVILDQWFKYWVSANIPVNEGIIRFIPNVLSIVNVHNDGAAFSFLAGGGARIWFILICGVFTVLVIIALAANWISKPVGRWSAVMVAAGGIGNCIDRILYGYVQDMFKVELFNFAVFNIADIFITVFCIVFIFYVLFGTRASEDEEDEEEEEEVEEVKPQRRGRMPAQEAVPARRPVQQRPAQAPANRPANVSDNTIVRTRKDSQARYEDEYEKYKAERAARQAAMAARQQPQAARPQPQSSAKDGPFAEWEQVSARQAQQRRQTADGFNAVAPQRQAPAARPAAPAPAPVQKPQAKPAPSSEDEFDLESILKEFR